MKLPGRQLNQLALNDARLAHADRHHLEVWRIADGNRQPLAVRRDRISARASFADAHCWSAVGRANENRVEALDARRLFLEGDETAVVTHPAQARPVEPGE